MSSSASRTALCAETVLAPIPMSGARMASVTSASSRRTRTPRSGSRSNASAVRATSDARELPDRLGVGPRDPRALGRQRDGAVHRAGVDEDEAQHFGEAPGHGALARAGGAVDGDDGTSAAHAVRL